MPETTETTETTAPNAAIVKAQKIAKTAKAVRTFLTTTLPKVPANLFGKTRVGNMTGGLLTFGEFMRQNGLEPTWKLHAAKRAVPETDESQKAQYEEVSRPLKKQYNEELRPAFFQHAKDAAAQLCARPELDVVQVKPNAAGTRLSIVLAKRKEMKGKDVEIAAMREELAKARAELAAMRACVKAAVKPQAATV